MMDIAVAPPDEDGIVLVTLGGDDDQPWGTPQEECAILAPHLPTSRTPGPATDGRPLHSDDSGRWCTTGIASRRTPASG